MPPLNGTIAFPKVNHITLAITNDLNFNVSWRFDISFNEAGSITKRRQGFGTCRLEEGGKILAIANYPHTLPATSHGSLDDHGKTNLLHKRFGTRGIFDGVTSRHDWHTGSNGRRARTRLIRKSIQILHGGSDECNARILTRLCELGTLAQEPVAWMNGIDAALVCNLDNLLNVKIRTNGSGTLLLFEDVTLIGTPAMLAVAIFIDVDCNTGHVEFGRGALDADGDFGAIGRHYFFEGGWGKFVRGDYLWFCGGGDSSVIV
mmetsp:Transcript_30589/g.64717  ORF Transcript_30589/g.64717 Transcript_30589/m.64717 type:complete len:261 (-) Transcript_30589:276-1058(-)